MRTDRCYTWGIRLTVAYLDILGFRSAMRHIEPPRDSHCVASNSGDYTFSLWNDCLPSRDSLCHSPKLNLVQMSDAVVFYGDDPVAVLNQVSKTFGRAVDRGVPIRGGVGFGILNHAESLDRPGTVLNLYGDGLNDAYEAEQAHGLGMRLLLSARFRQQSAIAGTHLIQGNTNHHEFPWWLHCGLDPINFNKLTNSWWTDRRVGSWFDGPQREDTVAVFSTALIDMRKVTAAMVQPISN